jgi:PAS domain-containing protein
MKYEKILEKLILDHNKLGILIVDQEFNINYANKKIKEIFEIKEDEEDF